MIRNCGATEEDHRPVYGGVFPESTAGNPAERTGQSAKV